MNDFSEQVALLMRLVRKIGHDKIPDILKAKIDLLRNNMYLAKSKKYKINKDVITLLSVCQADLAKLQTTESVPVSK